MRKTKLKHIKAQLRKLFPSPGYCVFGTNAVGMGVKNSHLIHFEIVDTKKELKRSTVSWTNARLRDFQDSNLFYFVIQEKLNKGIDTNSDAGVISLDKEGSGLQVTLEAPLRELDSGVSMSFVRKMLRSFMDKEDRWLPKHAIRFLGEDATLRDVDNYIFDRLDFNRLVFSYSFIQDQVDKLVEVGLTKTEKYMTAVSEFEALKGKLKYYSKSPDRVLARIKNMSGTVDFLINNSKVFVRLAETIKRKGEK